MLNVVTHAPGEAVPIADEFFERPEVRCINFTGSSATGRILAERAGRALKRCVLELGGYNPLIVLGDADLDYAVEAAAFAAFFHSGQICMSARKVLVERPVYDTFVERLTARARELRSGDPADPGTVIGPLINPAALDRVARDVGDAVAAGATVLAGGTADGPCYRPTISHHPGGHRRLPHLGGCPGLSRVRPGCTPVMIRTYGWCQRPPRVRSSGVANTVPTPGVTA